MEAASVIAFFLRKQCMESPWDRSKTQRCWFLLSRSGVFTDPAELTKEQRVTEVKRNECLSRNLKVLGSSRGGKQKLVCLGARDELRLDTRLWWTDLATLYPQGIRSHFFYWTNTGGHRREMATKPRNAVGRGCRINKRINIVIGIFYLNETKLSKTFQDEKDNL